MKLNDVGFSLHGFFVAMIFVCQCIAYERGQQRVSGFCKFILFGVFLILGWLIYNFSISTLPELEDLLEVFFYKNTTRNKNCGTLRLRLLSSTNQKLAYKNLIDN